MNRKRERYPAKHPAVPMTQSDAATSADSLTRTGEPDGYRLVITQTAPEDRSDFNEHMNVRFHFDLLCDAIGADLERRGFDDSYRDLKRKGIFTVDHAIHYNAEIRVGDRVQAFVRLDRRQGKSLHYSATLLNLRIGTTASSMTTVLLHVDLNTRRAIDFSDEVASAIDRSLAKPTR